MSDDSNNVHFSGIRFVCSSYLAMKSGIALLRPIMTKCGPQMNVQVQLHVAIYRPDSFVLQI